MLKAKVGRNDCCPCGSGKKYKKCCISDAIGDVDQNPKGLYRFESGSYGDVGSFMPSLACLKQTKIDEWKYHFVLVKPESMHAEEDDAVEEAEKDISEAYGVKEAGGSDSDLAIVLRKKGYVSVDNYRIVGQAKFQA